jgi:limonene-1,2-epoxide hydrolase
MLDSTILIRNFFASWGPAEENLHRAMHAYLSSDALWENIGLVTTKGPDEAVDLLKRFSKKGNFAAFDVEILNIAAAQNIVFCERIDHAIRADGSHAAHGVRVTGVFEFANGKIVAWRDYFDTAPFLQPNKA